MQSARLQTQRSEVRSLVGAILFINWRQTQGCMSSYEVQIASLYVYQVSSHYTDILLGKSTEKETNNKIAGEKTRENVEKGFR